MNNWNNEYMAEYHRQEILDEAEQIRLGNRRRADDVDRLDHRPGTRIDSEDQGRPVRLVRDVDARFDIGVEVAALPEQVRHYGGSLRRTPE